MNASPIAASLLGDSTIIVPGLWPAIAPRHTQIETMSGLAALLIFVVALIVAARLFLRGSEPPRLNAADDAVRRSAGEALVHPLPPAPRTR